MQDLKTGWTQAMSKEERPVQSESLQSLEGDFDIFLIVEHFTHVYNEI